MNNEQQTTILCLASYFKGTTFLTAAKRHGARVLLLTREKIKDEAWPMEDIDERFLMPDLSTRPDIIYAVSYLNRANDIVQIVPLDDYDVETAAALREHLRLPGLGETVVRYFRDKLAMRQQARANDILVPEFTPIFNYDRLRAFMERVPPPWVLKPRSEAGAMGIKKVHSDEEVWRWLDQLGDQQSFFHLEQFVPGEVYHVDSIIWDGKNQFALPHQYTQPPMSVAHEGGVFVTRTLPRDSDDSRQLLDLNQRLLHAFQITRGVAHTEFIKSEDGQFYFLETAARVGGANIEQLVEAATGINLWVEWARLEIAFARGEKYQPPHDLGQYAGVLICLAQQEYPDLSSYQDPEIVYRVNKKQHAGLIVSSTESERIEFLIADYSQRFAVDFLAVAPPLDKPPS
jgi:phosphoribosylaminoimidazole carboxylase (NCAIR synthetase)